MRIYVHRRRPRPEKKASKLSPLTAERTRTTVPYTRLLIAPIIVSHQHSCRFLIWLSAISTPQKMSAITQ